MAPPTPDMHPLTLERDVPLLTHPAILGSTTKLWIITGLLMLVLVGGIIGIQDGIKAVVPIAAMMMLLTGGLFMLSLLVMLVVSGKPLRPGLLGKGATDPMVTAQVGIGDQ